MRETSADQLLQALRQEKRELDQSVVAYQQHLKAQLVSPAMLSAAFGVGIVLSHYIFPKKVVEQNGSESPNTAHADVSFFVMNLIRDVAVTSITPLLTEWLAQKSQR
jgi:hypothetical protein